MIHLHEFLKSETSGLHARAEGAFARFDLTRRDDYGAFLQAQSAALLPLEAALEAQGAGALLEDWPQRQRSTALLADLVALGLAPGEPQPQPGFANSAQLLGALYVLEGSKLGARFLLARVVAANPDADGATAFLSHGSAPAQKGQWPSFLAILATTPVDESRAADVLAGATIAFGLFERAALDLVKA